MTFYYLEVPFFMGHPMIAHLRPLVDKILLQLNAWKGALLSFASRVSLINSMITSKFFNSFMIY